MILRTTDSGLATRNGQAVTVLGVLTDPDDYHDAEVLPMYRVQFADGFGSRTEVWDDELADR